MGGTLEGDPWKAPIVSSYRAHTLKACPLSLSTVDALQGVTVDDTLEVATRRRSFGKCFRMLDFGEISPLAL